MPPEIAADSQRAAGPDVVTRLFRRHRAPCVVTMGVFDGVHAGHRRVLATASALARSRGLRLTAVTLSPRPDQVFAPATALPDLCSLAERERRLRAAGADAVVVLPFTSEVIDVDAPTFVRKLKQELGAEALCVGEDFALGRGRAGDVPALRALGLEVATCSLVRDAEGTKISSSLLRAAACAGEAVR